MPATTPSVSKPATGSLFWELMAGFRGLYLVGIALLFLSTLFTLAVPLIGAATLNVLLPGEESTVGGDFLTSGLARLLGGDEWIRAHLWVPALVMLFLTAISGTLSYGKGRCAALASDGIARRLKDRLYDHLQHLPAHYHDRADSGDLIQRCTSDVETFRMALANQIIDVSNAVLLLLTAIPLMLLLDARMAGISLILVIPLIIFGFFYFRRVKFIFLAVDEAEAEVTRVVQENITGLRVVRAFSRQPYEREKFARPNQSYRDKYLRLINLMAVYWSFSDWIVLLQQGLVLFAGVYFIQQGSFTVGGLFAFLMFLNIFLWPVRQMGRTLTEFGKSQVAVTRLGEILAEVEEVDQPGAEAPRLPSRGRLEVRDLVFHHTPQSAALRGVSFVVEPGQTLAILGPSGAGKSTLFHLLLRLYEYEEGSICIDGQEIRGLSRDWVRDQFSVVMQEPFLFSKTVGANIRLGRSTAAEEDITHAASVARVHETISRFPKAYDTLVGERGITLSGGQRQRVAIARALLRKTPFLLLDDALSAVDAETEEHILEALKERRGESTTLVIAHRLSTLAQADWIIVLEEGRITQAGRHEDLLQEPGLYQRLWDIQTRVEEIA